MFVQLGVLLSTLFTPVPISTPVSTSFSFPVVYHNNGGNNFVPYTDNYTQVYKVDFTPLNGYLTQAIDYTEDGYYDVTLFTFSYSDSNFTLSNFLNVSCYFEVYSYYPSPNAEPVLYTRNYNFSFNYLDYDYPNLPTFNFDMVYYWSASSDADYNKSHRNYFSERGTPDNPAPMFYREWQDFSDYLDSGTLYDFHFYIEFHWISNEVYNNALNGYNPDYTRVYNDGYSAGYRDGKSVGVEEGSRTGYDSGYNTGYADGVAYESSLANKYTFKELFGTIADVPIYILHSLLGFDVFGVKAITILMSMITGTIAIFLLRKFL